MKIILVMIGEQSFLFNTLLLDILWIKLLLFTLRISSSIKMAWLALST